jgi:hypothetical protein
MRLLLAFGLIVGVFHLSFTFADGTEILYDCRPLALDDAPEQALYVVSVQPSGQVAYYDCELLGTTEPPPPPVPLPRGIMVHNN